MNPFKKLVNAKRKAETGLQNYGYNIAKRVAKGQATQPAAQKAGNTYRAINPFPNPFKKSSYKK
jgi:hypothetical protein